MKDSFEFFGLEVRHGPSTLVCPPEGQVLCITNCCLVVKDDYSLKSKSRVFLKVAYNGGEEAIVTSLKPDLLETTSLSLYFSPGVESRFSVSAAGSSNQDKSLSIHLSGYYQNMSITGIEDNNEMEDSDLDYMNEAAAYGYDFENSDIQYMLEDEDDEEEEEKPHIKLANASWQQYDDEDKNLLLEAPDNDDKKRRVRFSQGNDEDEEKQEDKQLKPRKRKRERGIIKDDDDDDKKKKKKKKKKNSMNLLPSGIKYSDETVGTGPLIKQGEKVKLRFEGMLSSGVVFDGNWDEASPLICHIGNQQGVVKGFNQGFEGMRIGGIRKLIIPSKLGYGKTQHGVVPPNSKLFYRIEALGRASSKK